MVGEIAVGELAISDNRHFVLLFFRRTPD